MVRKLLSLLSMFMLISCSGIIHAPGGSEAVNKSFYKTDTDLKTRIADIQTGMSKQAVFDTLERNEDDFVILSRSEILTTLYGQQQSYSYASPNSGQNIDLSALSGYKLLFKSVKRKHGFSSPISLKTKKDGFDYVAVFIFKDGQLNESPILSGGVVEASSTKTIFDYLNPSMVLGRAGL